MDHHHNVDVKTATKVRFQEPGSNQANGVEEGAEKLLQETESSQKENDISGEGQAKSSETTDKAADEGKNIGGSPKQDNKENAEKEAKSSQDKKAEEAKEASKPTP